MSNFTQKGFIGLVLLTCFTSTVYAGGKKSKKIDSGSLGSSPSSTHKGKCVGCSENSHRKQVKVKNSVCDLRNVTDQWRKNCDKLMRSSRVPKAAALYALQVMKMNDTSFRSNKCYKVSTPHYSMAGRSRGSFRAKMSRGLKNKCEFVINDTTSVYRGKDANNINKIRPERNKKRGDKLTKRQRSFLRNMYYIDLCSGSSPKIKKTYFSLGYGSVNKNYKNTGGLGTTVKGAFFTNDRSFSFKSNDKSYHKVRKAQANYRGGYKMSSLQLFGLQRSNNLASQNKKYMHVSDNIPSAGCPSTHPKNHGMIETLAKNGPSLVLNWGENMENIKGCSI